MSMSRRDALEKLLQLRTEVGAPFSDDEIAKFLDDAAEDPAKAMFAMDEVWRAWRARRTAEMDQEMRASVRANAEANGIDPDFAERYVVTAVEEIEAEMARLDEIDGDIN
jgi:hypothetical protein